jgi:two-component system KDP operon response regulator KdpE
MPSRSQIILLVEDDADLRRMYRTALTIEGFELQEASNGYDALRLLEQGGAKLVALDLGLPLIDGTTVLREMTPKQCSCRRRHRFR